MICDFRLLVVVITICIDYALIINISRRIIMMMMMMMMNDNDLHGGDYVTTNGCFCVSD
jgi:hypothetical protein